MDVELKCNLNRNRKGAGGPREEESTAFLIRIFFQKLIENEEDASREDSGEFLIRIKIESNKKAGGGIQRIRLSSLLEYKQNLIEMEEDASREDSGEFLIRS